MLRALPVGLVLDGRDGVRDPSGAAHGGAGRAPPSCGRSPRAPARCCASAPSRCACCGRPARAARPTRASDPNQRAIVAEADAGGVRTLLTADAESDVLAGLDLGPVDVLKVSHHGSADPGLPAAAAAPATAAGGDRGRAPQRLWPSRRVDRPRAARCGRRARPHRPRRQRERRAGGRSVAYPRSRLDSYPCPRSSPPTSSTATITAASASGAPACARWPRRSRAAAASRSSTATTRRPRPSRWPSAR